MFALTTSPGTRRTRFFRFRHPTRIASWGLALRVGAFHDASLFCDAADAALCKRYCPGGGPEAPSLRGRDGVGQRPPRARRRGIVSLLTGSEGQARPWLFWASIMP